MASPTTGQHARWLIDLQPDTSTGPLIGSPVDSARVRTAGVEALVTNAIATPPLHRSRETM